MKRGLRRLEARFEPSEEVGLREEEGKLSFELEESRPTWLGAVERSKEEEIRPLLGLEQW